MAFEDWVIAHARVSSKRHQRIKLDDQLTFFQQLSTLVESGTPLLQAIRICGEQNPSSRMQHVLEEIAARIAAGSSLNAAAAQCTDAFAPHWIEVIRTGEITGQMAAVLL